MRQIGCRAFLLLCELRTCSLLHLIDDLARCVFGMLKKILIAGVLTSPSPVDVLTSCALIHVLTSPCLVRLRTLILRSALCGIRRSALCGRGRSLTAGLAAGGRSRPGSTFFRLSLFFRFHWISPLLMRCGLPPACI